MLAWRFAHFDKLTSREVHDLLQARAEVFVLEQKCAFQDVDGVDPACWHLLGRQPGAEHGPVLAYCRLVPPGIKFAEPSIGRVLTTAGGRASGAGRALMREAVARTGALWPGRGIRIGAQQYLEKFYGDFGFVRCSEPYDEDGIVHIEMLRAADDPQHH